MTLKKFIEEYFIELHGNFYSRYDIAEVGFAFQDASVYTEEEVEEEYQKYQADEEKWLADYRWKEQILGQ